MSLLRAQVRKFDQGTPDEWWQMSLLDLDVVADGRNEDEVLRDVEHALFGEYELAVLHGRPPFIDRMREDCPQDVIDAWTNGNKIPAKLNLPQRVRVALAIAFKSASTVDFEVGVCERAA